MNSSSIAGLLVQLRCGEHVRARWGELHERFWPFLVKRAMDCGLSATDAEDVASHVMMRLPGQLRAEKYDASKGHFEAWLTTVIRNAVKDYFKSRMHRDRRHLLDDSSYEQVVGRLAAVESVTTLASDLCQLYDSRLRDWALQVRSQVSDWEWRAFFRTAVRRLPAKEVAEQLKTSPSKVYQATYKVRRLLEQVVTPPTPPDANRPGPSKSWSQEKGQV